MNIYHKHKQAAGRYSIRRSRAFYAGRAVGRYVRHTLGGANLAFWIIIIMAWLSYSCSRL